jgi:hypothetical protein
MTTTKEEPKFSDVYLKTFIKNNSFAEVNIEGDNLLIDKPWGRNDARLKSDISNHNFISALNGIIFNPKYDALFHSKANKAEFIFSFINPDSEDYRDIKDRKFSVHFGGQCYKCYFSEPSEELMIIAKHFERLPSDVSVNSAPQIQPFKDYQNLDNKDTRVKKYFEDKIARNFFIESQTAFDLTTFENLCKHVNFLMSYYDRETPLIEIKPDIDQQYYKNKPAVRLTEGSFPEIMIAHPIDEIIMKLIDVARGSNPRFSFLYYYQVCEYAGYYYIDENAKRELRRFLKDPALVNCGEEKVSELFAILTEINHADDVKIKKVIEEYCDPKILWREINNDKDFFSEDHEFEGGFFIKSLIAKDTTEESWSKMWMPKLYDHLTKIRNSLVHAREKRENKVILPSASNNARLTHYTPLIRRLAEQIALRSS